ncbi:MAG TPA: trehalose-phosphatase [Micrococcaceae bacterium]|nr:trehalose-phosphatase [Micrococcaceae bacterium]
MTANHDGGGQLPGAPAVSAHDDGGQLPGAPAASPDSPADDSGVPADLAAAVGRACRTEHLLVAMDFDGTLSPLVARAEDARPLPAAAAAFAAVAGLPRTTTALISGRALASLRAVASPPAGTLMIGSHGAEVWLGHGAPPLMLDEHATHLLAQVTGIVQDLVAAYPGTVLEKKPAGVVLHTRLAEDDVAAAAVEEAHRKLDGLDGAHVSEGKRVLEVSVVRADKGQGLRQLQEVSGATAVIFAGDDVTDEHGFAALGPSDVGVKVGQGPTEAAFRIGSPEDVPALLELILAARSAAVNPGSPA